MIIVRHQPLYPRRKGEINNILKTRVCRWLLMAILCNELQYHLLNLLRNRKTCLRPLANLALLVISIAGDSRLFFFFVL